MSHPARPVRRSAGRAALALGVSSVVTGTLVLGAGPAPANDPKGKNHGGAHASTAEKSSRGGGSSSHSGGGSSSHSGGGSSSHSGGGSSSHSGGGSSAQAGGHSRTQQSTDNRSSRRPGGAGQANGNRDRDANNQGAGNQGAGKQNAGKQRTGGHGGPPSSKSRDGSAQKGGGAGKQSSAGSGNKSPNTGDRERGKPGTADRPGNNGTVKVDAEEFDSHPDNQPHVGCNFQIDFYNYGMGDYYALVNFDAHSPTAGYDVTVTGDRKPFIGEDPPGGGTDVDHQGEYTLSFDGEPHHRQGYHVKLTINAPYSQGADTKHKVFWVQPCDGADEAGKTTGPGARKGKPGNQNGNPDNPKGNPDDNDKPRNQDGNPEDRKGKPEQQKGQPEDQKGAPEDEGKQAGPKAPVTQPQPGTTPPKKSEARPDAGAPAAPGPKARPGDDERVTAGERPVTGVPPAGAPAPRAQRESAQENRRGPVAAQPEAGLGAGDRQTPERGMGAGSREAAPGAEVPTQVPAGVAGDSIDGTGTGSLAAALGLSGLLAAAGAFVTSRRRRTQA